MGNVYLSAVLAALACLQVIQAGSSKPSSPSDPYGYCVKCTPVTGNISLDVVKGDWLVVYSTNNQYRQAASYYGGDFPFDFCDPLNLNKGCMAAGYSLLNVNNTEQRGISYTYNAFTDVWTLEQVTNSLIQIPGTNYIGYRTTYEHYVQIDENNMFKDGQALSTCGSKVLRSGPIYRSANYVVLANAPDFSWLLLLYCDSFYGFVDKYSPFVQIVVKKEVISKISYPFNSLYFYEDVKAALLKNKINVYAGDINLVYHDQNSLYPVATNWESIKWEADCLCRSTIVKE